MAINFVNCLIQCPFKVEVSIDYTIDQIYLRTVPLRTHMHMATAIAERSVPTASNATSRVRATRVCFVTRKYCVAEYL